MNDSCKEDRDACIKTLHAISQAEASFQEFLRSAPPSCAADIMSHIKRHCSIPENKEPIKNCILALFTGDTKKIAEILICEIGILALTKSLLEGRLNRLNAISDSKHAEGAD